MEVAPSLDRRFPVITDSLREVIALSKHSRRPRRQSRLVIVLQNILLVLQIVLVMAELAVVLLASPVVIVRLLGPL